MTINVALSKAAFDQPWDPVTSQGMMYTARQFEALWNNLLNGDQAFERQLFTAATQKTISGGAITAPTLQVHTVAAETGSSDDLDTITAANNTYVILKAASGHTITIRHGAGNIWSVGGGSLTLTGNRLARLWSIGGQWAMMGIKRRVDNLTATSDPGSGDDLLDGYAVGSVWVNTALDRAWLCVDATPGVAVWRPIHQWKNGYSIRAANNTLVAVGTVGGFSIVGAPVAGNDAANTYLSLVPSPAADGNECSYSENTGGRGWRAAHNPVYEAWVKTGPSIADQRLWIGIFDGSIPDDASTLSGARECIAFRYDTEAGDTGFRPVLRDGSTQNTGAALNTLAVDTAYKLKIRIVSSGTPTAYFSVNDGAEVAMTTNFPALTTDLKTDCRFLLTAAISRTFNLSRVELNW